MSEPAGTAPSQTRTVVTDDGVHIRLFIYPAGVSEPLAVAELSLEVTSQIIAELSAALCRHLRQQRNHRIGVRRQP